MSSTLKFKTLLCLVGMLSASPASAHDLGDMTPAEMNLGDYLTLTFEAPDAAHYDCPDCEDDILFTVEALPSNHPDLSLVVDLLARDTVHGAPLHLVRNDCADRGCSVSLQSGPGGTNILKITFEAESDPQSNLTRILRMALHEDQVIRTVLSSSEPLILGYLDFVTRQNLEDLIEAPHAN